MPDVSDRGAKMIVTDMVRSYRDGLALDIAITEPKPNIKPRAAVQFSHGMAEHKERYLEFMRYLSSRGFICVIHDHRGHGRSIKAAADLGYFYTRDFNYLSDDLYRVTAYIKDKYKNLPIYLFSHSMGTLVARNYLKKHDTDIQKLVLCGPPTENPKAGMGIAAAKAIALFGDRRRSRILNKLADGSYNNGFETRNAWLNTDMAEVEKYNADRLCGYTFTVNGYINLFGLMQAAYNAKDWRAVNKNLDIFIIAGSDDPVIQSKEKLYRLKSFLQSVGYSSVDLKIYPGMRHEILNEKSKNIVFNDVFEFLC